MIKSFGPINDTLQTHLPPQVLTSWVTAHSQGSKESQDKGKDSIAGHVQAKCFSILNNTLDLYIRHEKYD